MKIYNLLACEKLISQYAELGGEVDTIREGILGLGTIILHRAPGKKSIIINEVYLNANSSGHTIRMYNRLPKKYARQVQ